MNIRPVLLVVGLALSANALAQDDCPGMLAKIDAALAEKSQTEKDVRDKVEALRAEGEQLLKAGKTEECQKPLNEALAMLEEG